MTGAPHRPALAASLPELAAACEAAVTQHTGSARRPPGRRFTEHVSLALGSLRACAERPELDHDDLRLLVAACTDAAAACRAQPVSAETRTATTAFEQAATACSNALGKDTTGSDDAPGSTRFLFEDADFAVRRAGRRWQARTRGGEAEAPLLDEAIAQLFPSLSNTRLAELTVHILEWSADAQGGREVSLGRGPGRDALT